MIDLTRLFEDLLTAADQGRFESALLSSALGQQPVSHHPLGFHVVKLEAGTTALRLHLWKPGGGDQPGYEIHDHIFALRSRVIEGAIRHRTYSIRTEPLGAHAVYSVTYNGEESRIAKSDRRVSLQRETQEIFRAGSAYSVPAGELHDAELAEGTSATTLVLTQHVGGIPRTIGPWDGPEALSASRSQMTPQLLRDLGLERAKNL